MKPTYSHYIEMMKKEQENDDTELAHCNADDILCDFLESLGYSEIIKEYKKIYKWYA